MTSPQRKAATSARCALASAEGPAEASANPGREQTGRAFFKVERDRGMRDIPNILFCLGERSR